MILENQGNVDQLYIQARKQGIYKNYIHAAVDGLGTIPVTNEAYDVIVCSNGFAPGDDMRFMEMVSQIQGLYFIIIKIMVAYATTNMKGEYLPLFFLSDSAPVCLRNSQRYRNMCSYAICNIQYAICNMQYAMCNVQARSTPRPSLRCCVWSAREDTFSLP